MFSLSYYYRLSIIILFARAVIGDGKVKNDDRENTQSLIPNFLNLNKQKHVNTVRDMESHISKFEKSCSYHLETINIKLEMVIRSLVQTEEKLNILEVLTDLSKKCVTQHRQSIKTTEDTKTKINNCVTAAQSKVKELIAGLMNTRNDMANIYDDYYGKEIANCAKNYTIMPTQHLTCIKNAATFAEAAAINIKNKFEAQMKAASIARNDYGKEALKCSYTIESAAITSIAEANTLINNCMFNRDNCPKCETGYTCPNGIQMRKSEVNYKNEFIVNPFYKLFDATNCLMLRLI